MKKVFFFLTFIGLISMVSAGCTPLAGYDYCWDYSNSYDDARAEVEIHTKSGIFLYEDKYSVGDSFIDYKVIGDKAYYYNLDSTSNFNWDNCDENGCNGERISNTGRLELTSGVGQTFQGCPFIIGWDKDTGDSGAWVWTGYSVYYSILGNCFDMKQVGCYENSDCSGEQVCNKDGEWNQWVCEEPPCNEDWNCGNWGDCTNNVQSRTCTTECGTPETKPEDSRSCECSEGEKRCVGEIEETCTRAGDTLRWVKEGEGRFSITMSIITGEDNPCIEAPIENETIEDIVQNETIEDIVQNETTEDNQTTEDNGFGVPTLQRGEIKLVTLILEWVTVAVLLLATIIFVMNRRRKRGKKR